jgi:hypothetical protein
MFVSVGNRPVRIAAREGQHRFVGTWVFGYQTPRPGSWKKRHVNGIARSVPARWSSVKMKTTSGGWTAGTAGSESAADAPVVTQTPTTLTAAVSIATRARRIREAVITPGYLPIRKSTG